MFAQSALLAETGKLQKFALRLTRNKADAEDLTQSTCLRALEKADHFEDGSNLFAWTSKIMFNLFISGYNRRVKFETQFDPESYLEKESVAPQQELVMELSNIKRAMLQLSIDHREILALVYVKGLCYKEVSDILQIPIGTVRSRLSRAISQLKIMMNVPPAPVGERAAIVVQKPCNLPHSLIERASLEKDSSGDTLIIKPSFNLGKKQKGKAGPDTLLVDLDNLVNELRRDVPGLGFANIHIGRGAERYVSGGRIAAR